MRATSSVGHFFLSDRLSPDSVVVDLGMNRGEFSREISERYGCRVIGVEPVPELFDALPEIPGVTAEHLAVNADGSPATLYLNGGESSTIVAGLANPEVEAVDVPAITLGDLFGRHRIAHAALVKFDVEGAELEILETVDSDTLDRIDQLTIEFHDWLDPGQAPGVARVKKRLRRHGFACVRPARNNSDVLFVNRARVGFGAIDRVRLVARYKYPQMLARVARRILRRTPTPEAT